MRLDLAWRSKEMNRVGINEFAGWVRDVGIDMMLRSILARTGSRSRATSSNNRRGGIILPQRVVPDVIIVDKQFFDAVPKEMREPVVLDGGKDSTLQFQVYLPFDRGSRRRSASSLSTRPGMRSCGRSS
ncbi:hypothetical protein [uncultured Jannaschia sp.]|uniref:hypothetical protein n=1 Tax=uncultured Jannaschia sp. TaxID=293347 RepID=UPI002626B52D|nr:hypothetical protein [uncultured Jannaschia sp.]